MMATLYCACNADCKFVNDALHTIVTVQARQPVEIADYLILQHGRRMALIIKAAASDHPLRELCA